MSKSIPPVVCCFIALCLSGCRKEPIAEFEPNMVFAYGVELQSGYPMQQALDETQVALTQLFGTPDEPTLPEFAADEEYADLLELDNLRLAAGPPTDAGGGLYRTHCSICHGVVGNGRGLTAALLDPYPRDYRHGKFKFKSTGLGDKPSRSDLFRSIKDGVTGTSMKPIPELSDSDIEALVDYVIYLAWRGELEREMLMEAESVAFEDGESLFNEASEEFPDQLELVNDFAQDIADDWVEAAESEFSVPAPPAEIPVPRTIEEVLVAASPEGAESTDPAIQQLRASIAKGREIFATEKASCTKCHGKEGYGDGQTQDYDDWAKDWTSRFGIDPNDTDALIPLIARGALPPRKILPRDFREGLFRGGGEPEDLYRRIAVGIAGTPMPAAANPPEDIWHLVNYVRSLKVEPAAQP